MWIFLANKWCSGGKFSLFSINKRKKNICLACKKRLQQSNVDGWSGFFWSLQGTAQAPSGRCYLSKCRTWGNACKAGFAWSYDTPKQSSHAMKLRDYAQFCCAFHLAWCFMKETDIGCFVFFHFLWLQATWTYGMLPISIAHCLP